MNYLFQIRGFPDVVVDANNNPVVLPDGNVEHPIDYSSQVFSPLSEINLSELTGIGPDSNGKAALYFTRWYGPPNTLQAQIGQSANAHCDGTPILDGAKMVRVDGTTKSSPIDWNNNGTATDTGFAQDINFNDNSFNFPAGSNLDPPFSGFNDWTNLDLIQVGARQNALGFSGGTGAGALPDSTAGGAQLDTTTGGAMPDSTTGGAPLDSTTGGAQLDTTTGGAQLDTTTGGEQNLESACSTADPPSKLTAVQVSHSVALNWSAPGGPCQVFQYVVRRSTNGGSFLIIATLGRNKVGKATTAPSTSFSDNTVKNNNTYSYLVQDTNVQGATSSSSNMTPPLFVKF